MAKTILQRILDKFRHDGRGEAFPSRVRRNPDAFEHVFPRRAGCAYFPVFHEVYRKLRAGIPIKRKALQKGLHTLQLFTL